MSGKRETAVLPVRALKCFLGIWREGGREGGNPFRLIDRTRRVKGNNAVSNHSNSGLCLKISLQVFLSPLPLSSRPSLFSFLSSLFFFPPLPLSSLSPMTRGHTLQACNYSTTPFTPGIFCTIELSSCIIESKIFHSTQKEFYILFLL